MNNHNLWWALRLPPKVKTWKNNVLLVKGSRLRTVVQAQMRTMPREQCNPSHRGRHYKRRCLSYMLLWWECGGHCQMSGAQLCRGWSGERYREFPDSCDFLLLHTWKDGCVGSQALWCIPDILLGCLVPMNYIPELQKNPKITSKTDLTCKRWIHSIDGKSWENW